MGKFIIRNLPGLNLKSGGLHFWKVFIPPQNKVLVGYTVFSMSIIPKATKVFAL